MRWTWDSDKNRENERKHLISFETAQLVFRDPYLIIIEDPFPHEQRWRTTGMIALEVITVIHTWPENNTVTGRETGRIISARKATRRERTAYEEG